MRTMWLSKWCTYIAYGASTIHLPDIASGNRTNTAHTVRTNIDVTVRCPSNAQKLDTTIIAAVEKSDYENRYYHNHLLHSYCVVKCFKCSWGVRDYFENAGRFSFYFVFFEFGNVELNIIILDDRRSDEGLTIDGYIFSAFVYRTLGEFRKIIFNDTPAIVLGYFTIIWAPTSLKKNRTCKL